MIRSLFLAIQVAAMHVTESIWRGVGKLSVSSLNTADAVIVGSENGVVAALSNIDGAVIWRRVLSSGPITDLSLRHSLVIAKTATT